ARLPTHGVPPPRLRALEQLLVRGPLLVRHLLAHLLPARRAARDPVARSGDDRDRRVRVHGGDLAAVGTGGALVEPDVRSRLGGDRPLGRVSVRARHGARTARALGVAGAGAVALRALRAA